MFQVCMRSTQAIAQYYVCAMGTSIALCTHVIRLTLWTAQHVSLTSELYAYQRAYNFVLCVYTYVHIFT